MLLFRIEETLLETSQPTSCHISLARSGSHSLLKSVSSEVNGITLTAYTYRLIRSYSWVKLGKRWVSEQNLTYIHTYMHDYPKIANGRSSPEADSKAKLGVQDVIRVQFL